MSDKIFLILSDCIGERGELGRLLMKGFLSTLEKAETPPRKVILLNQGVRLATEDDTAIEVLAWLATRGVEVLSCGTCLDYYGLKGALKVGTVTNMHDTVAALAGASAHVVTIS